MFASYLVLIPGLSRAVAVDHADTRADAIAYACERVGLAEAPAGAVAVRVMGAR